VVVLQALSLDDLAEDYLRTALSNHPAASPEFRLMLSRLEAGSGNVSLALFEAVKVVPDYRDMDFEALAKELWTLLYPRSYWSLIRRYAHANQLDPYLVMGLIRQESAFDPKATSTANARGLMQLLPETASGSRRRSRVRAAARRLYSPAYNIRAGCAHLRGLLKTFDGKPELALAAYHAGESRVEQWVEQAHIDDPTEFLETIPISTTRWYVERVLRDAAIYRQLMTGSPRFAVCASEARATSPRVRKKAPPGRNPGKAKVRKP
jgi:soluble lytic murein transglycosylase